MKNEVIIDGCNVAECEYYFEDNGIIAPDGTPERTDLCTSPEKSCENSDCCACNPNCYFKQLQRAKADVTKINIAYMELIQEIVAGIFYAGEIRPDNLTPLDVLRNIKKENKDLKAENDTLHITIQKLKADLFIAEDSLRDYQEHYNKLQAENEKLKETIKLYAEINENDTAYNAVLLKENKELKMKNNELLTRLSERYGVFK